MREPRRLDTKEAIIRAAERLFAEKGLGAVSVRDITVAAGARNQSALHYHFGGMEQLIVEVFAHSFRDIEEKRMERIAELDADGQSNDILALMRAAIAPLFETCDEENGRLYARFGVQILSDPRFSIPSLIDDLSMASAREIARRVFKALSGLPEASVTTRLRRVFYISTFMMADHARMIESGKAPPLEEAIEEAASTLAGFLKAPYPSPKA